MEGGRVGVVLGCSVLVLSASCCLFVFVGVWCCSLVFVVGSLFLVCWLIVVVVVVEVEIVACCVFGSVRF